MMDMESNVLKDLASKFSGRIEKKPVAVGIKVTKAVPVETEEEEADEKDEIEELKARLDKIESTLGIKAEEETETETEGE